MGYHRAGFDEIVGVDIAPQPRYPFAFVQADALEFPLEDFDLIHISPPCQDYAASGAFGRKTPGKYPRLIAPMRERLMAQDTPWVIENVMGAIDDLCDPIMLCGTMFGLRVQRHRLFESSHVLYAPPRPCRHRPGDVSVRRGVATYTGMYKPVTTKSGKVVSRAPTCLVGETRKAMGIHWMMKPELGEAIPPAYTEWLGAQLLAPLRQLGLWQEVAS
jgi:DNA (cytosine-5)-methyltransferase 1